MNYFHSIKKKVSLNGCRTHLRQIHTEDGGFLNEAIKKHRDGHMLSGPGCCVSKAVLTGVEATIFKLMISTCISSLVIWSSILTWGSKALLRSKLNGTRTTTTLTPVFKELHCGMLTRAVIISHSTCWFSLQNPIRSKAICWEGGSDAHPHLGAAVLGARWPPMGQALPAETGLRSYRAGAEVSWWYQLPSLGGVPSPWAPWVPGRATVPFPRELSTSIILGCSWCDGRLSWQPSGKTDGAGRMRARQLTVSVSASGLSGKGPGADIQLTGRSRSEGKDFPQHSVTWDCCVV